MGNQNKKALIIGVDFYTNNALDLLPSCKQDAQDLYNFFLNKGYTIYEDGPLIGSELDKQYGWVKIRETISNFFFNAKPSQILLFYFSGHGISRGNEVYLGTPQIDPKNPFSE